MACGQAGASEYVWDNHPVATYFSYPYGLMEPHCLFGRYYAAAFTEETWEAHISETGSNPNTLTQGSLLQRVANILAQQEQTVATRSLEAMALSKTWSALGSEQYNNNIKRLEELLAAGVEVTNTLSLMRIASTELMAATDLIGYSRAGAQNAHDYNAQAQVLDWAFSERMLKAFELTPRDSPERLSCVFGLLGMGPLYPLLRQHERARQLSKQKFGTHALMKEFIVDFDFDRHERLFKTTVITTYWNQLLTYVLLVYGYVS